MTAPRQPNGHCVPGLCLSSGLFLHASDDETDDSMKKNPVRSEEFATTPDFSAHHFAARNILVFQTMCAFNSLSNDMSAQIINTGQM